MEAVARLWGANKRSHGSYERVSKRDVLIDPSTIPLSIDWQSRMLWTNVEQEPLNSSRLERYGLLGGPVLSEGGRPCYML